MGCEQWVLALNNWVDHRLVLSLLQCRCNEVLRQAWILLRCWWGWSSFASFSKYIYFFLVERSGLTGIFDQSPMVSAKCTGSFIHSSILICYPWTGKASPAEEAGPVEIMWLLKEALNVSHFFTQVDAYRRGNNSTFSIQ